MPAGSGTVPALVMLGLLAAGLAAGGVWLLRNRTKSEELSSDWQVMQGKVRPLPEHDNAVALRVAPSTGLEWWYLDETRQEVGPLAEPAIRGLRMSGVVTDATLLWSERVEDWTPFAQALSLFGSSGGS
jgi:hypothetical protein